MIGFAIAGMEVANSIPAPTNQLRPVEADLAAPFAGSNLKASDFEVGGIYSDGAGFAHIDVLYKDINFLGIKADTITDGTAEFTLGGSAAGNVLVNGAGVQVDPGNPYLFRYTISKVDANKPFFNTDPTTAGVRPTVEITFIPNSFTDNAGRDQPLRRRDLLGLHAGAVAGLHVRGCGRRRRRSCRRRCC